MTIIPFRNAAQLISFLAIYWLTAPATLVALQVAIFDRGAQSGVRSPRRLAHQIRGGDHG